jgi:hypothetical protein
VSATTLLTCTKTGFRGQIVTCGMLALTRTQSLHWPDPAQRARSGNEAVPAFAERDRPGRRGRLTVAVNLTVCPTTDGSGEEASVVVVAAWV